MEAIAAEARVARTTIYRRWPNKATVIMDAFLAEVGPGIAFPKLPSALEVYDRRVKVREAPWFLASRCILPFERLLALQSAPCGTVPCLPSCQRKHQQPVRRPGQAPSNCGAWKTSQSIRFRTARTQRGNQRRGSRD